MTFQEIKLLAWNGATETEIDKMNAPEYTCYCGLVYIFNQYKADSQKIDAANPVEISELKGQQQKLGLKIQREFEYFSNAFAANVKNISDWCGYIKSCGTLRSEINKSTDIKQIADKALKCISLMTGDETFYKENIKKLEG